MKKIFQNNEVANLRDIFIKLGCRMEDLLMCLSLIAMLGTIFLIMGSNSVLFNGDLFTKAEVLFIIILCILSSGAYNFMPIRDGPTAPRGLFSSIKSFGAPKEDRSDFPSIRIALTLFIIPFSFTILELIQNTIYESTFLIFIILSVFALVVVYFYSKVYKCSKIKIHRDSDITIQGLWKSTFSTIYAGLVGLWMISFWAHIGVLKPYTLFFHDLNISIFTVLLSIILISCSISFVIFLFCYITLLEKFFLHIH